MDNKDQENVIESTESETIKPLLIEYCPICTMPFEYCAYGPCPERCAQWHHENKSNSKNNDTFNQNDQEKLCESTEKLIIDDRHYEGNDSDLKEEKGEGEEGDSRKEEGKKHQSRGGKCISKDPQIKEQKEMERKSKCKIIIKSQERNKRKSITTVKGLDVMGLDIKAITKKLSNKFACGCSAVTNPSNQIEIVIQGDFTFEVKEFLLKEHPAINENQIEIHEK